jgi:hypothetical protein
LQAIHDWSKAAQLSLALDKCFVLHFGNPCDPCYVENNAIPVCDTVRDLGVMVSSNLKFSAHCRLLAKNCTRLVNLIFMSFKNRSHSFLLKVYKAFVLSKIECNSEIWNPYLLEDNIDCL